MPIALAYLIHPSVTRWYRCVTRCVRRTFLLGEGHDDRKVWIENRLRVLAEISSGIVPNCAFWDMLTWTVQARCTDQAPSVIKH